MASAVSLALATAPICVPAHAQEGREAVPIAISSRPLGESLVELARQTGIRIIAPGKLVNGRQAPALDGKYTADDALDTILQGTNLTVITSADGTLILQKVVQAPDAARTAESTQREEDLAELEEIVVRGTFQDSLINRLPLTEQELPFTLDTLSRDDITERAFIRPIDVLDTLPNVQIGVDQFGIGTPFFLARGFNAPILVNNRVASGLRSAGQRDDAFVERYEVLKGPASIALGPIAGGGVINTVTKTPGAEDFIDLSVAADNFGSLRGDFDLNDAELFGSETIGGRLSGAIRDFNFDPGEADRKERAIRPVIAFDNGGGTSARISFAYREIATKPIGYFALFDDGGIPDNFDTGTFFGLSTVDTELQDQLLDAQVVHEFIDGLQLTLRGSRQVTDLDYRDRNGLYNYNYDNGRPGVSRDNPVANGYSQNGVSEEETDFLDAQLLYSFDVGGKEQSVVVGSSYVDNVFTIDRDFLGVIGPFSYDNIDAPRAGLPLNTTPSLTSMSNVRDELFSVYAEAVIRPIERLTIVGGLRYDDLETSTDVVRLFSDGRELETLISAQDDAVTGRLGASYEFTPSLNVFISYAEAFEPQRGILESGEPVGVQRSRNYEAGLKGALFNERLSFTFAAFETTRFDIAVDAPRTGDIFEEFQVLIGEQTNSGIELSSSFQADNGFRLDVNYGLLDQTTVENLDGARIATFPEHQVSVFGTYTIQAGALSGLSVGGGFRHFAERESDLPSFDYPSVTIGDARLAYPLTENTQVSLNVINVTDELYLESAAGGVGSVGGQHGFGTPRTFVLSFSMRL
ncbi:MAG: TonB-dependent receptor [Pseudomonadota bacterium]